MNSSRRFSGSGIRVAVLALSVSGCSELLEGPSLSAGDVEPDLFCGAELPQTVTLTGTGFAPLPTRTLEGTTRLLLPKVEILPVAGIDGAGEATSAFVVADDAADPTSSALHFISDREMQVNLGAGRLNPGVYDVRVTNPDGAATATWSSSLAVVPAPELEGFDEKLQDLACLAEADQVRTVTGRWFARVDGAPPTVGINGQSFEVLAMGGCSTVSASIANALELCSSITFKLPKGSLEPGAYKVSVTNPDPVGCTAEKTLDLAIVAAPTVIELVPAAVCGDGQDKTITVEGEGFLVVDGSLPTVTIDGMPAMLAGPPADCMPLGDAFPAVESCNQLFLTVSNDTPPGDHAIAVANPAPVECVAESPTLLSISPIPTVASAAPTPVCSGGSSLTITGSGFWVDSNDNLPLVSLVPQGGGDPVHAAIVTCVDCDPLNQKPGTTLQAVFGIGAKVGTTYSVVVTNPGACVSPAPLPTTAVLPGPQLYLVEPFVVPNAINTRVTLYTTTFQQPLPNPAVWMVPAGQIEPKTNLTLQPLDPAFPKRIQAVVPKGAAAGTYDVYLKDATNCAPTLLPEGLIVTDKQDLTLAAVSPPFGAVSAETAVTIRRDAQKSKATFVATPRVYLNPAKSMNPPDDAKAIRLASTTFLDADTLTAIVPTGTPAGLYDVVVVNPDPTAEIGILYDGFRSVVDPPPAIANVVPPSMKNQAGQVVELQGDFLRPGVVVTASCVDGNKQPIGAPAVVAGMPTCNAQGKSCTLSATINGSGLPQGAVCTLRATNTDKTYGDFSAIGVTNASLNLPTPKLGVEMLVARRGLGSASAKATSAARFLYAIAGDNGTDAGTMSDVESIAVDAFGTMAKSWVPQRHSLNQKRAFFGTAQSPRYLYVVGGTSNGNDGALASAERAQVLDPRESPEIVDLDFSYELFGGSGLGAGEWIYRVSAEFAANDPHNPGGEGLASDPLILKLPTGSQLGVTIYWKAPVDCAGQPLPNVAKYRVYRSPTANAGSGKEQQIAEVPGGVTSFFDTGAAPKAGQIPLSLGATGKWALLPSLGTNRERNGVAAVMGVDPTTPTTKRHLYALFGRNKDNELDTYQYLSISVDACGREVVAPAWTTGVNSSQQRMRHMAWIVDRSVRADVGTTTNYIYVGGGRSGNSQITSVYRAKVGPTGDLGQFTQMNQIPGGGATGSGVLAAAQQLFAFAGQQGNNFGITDKGVGSSISDAAGSLSNWNAGLNLALARAFMGSSVQSAFAFFLGGQTTNANATKSTESVVW